ncbi:hypothetical protein [Actinacidiphila paucisporea]|uniref:Uncharacterized protein n=1 Tax=Actinacidiphila paucisporea TaxID=310782 RepID=A0A1M7MPF2_9ACTN|nr:hypothetical protein [Actinacidiphila paucisporea]SHM92862.1 hypothetical protein SAMN05216499_116129 [Actinacidiphila paucisporea]
MAFPYTVTPTPHAGALRRYVCVDFQVLAGHTVDTSYRGNCSTHPRPLSSPAAGVN